MAKVRLVKLLDIRRELWLNLMKALIPRLIVYKLMQI